MTPRPLSEHAKGILRDMAEKPIPLPQVNPGVSHRLRSEGLAVTIEHRSPYAKHKGGTCQHLAITDKGRAVV